MNGEQAALMATAGGAVALLLLVACVLLWRTSHRLATRVAQLEAERTIGSQRPSPSVRTSSASSRAATHVVTAPQGADAATGAPPESETGLSVHDAGALEPVVTGRIDGALFADIVARESVIKAAGLVHGLRRALSAESRNRIRFEMRREVKRSRKRRRSDLKAALRDARSRERADLAQQDGEDAA